MSRKFSATDVAIHNRKVLERIRIVGSTVKSAAQMVKRPGINPNFELPAGVAKMVKKPRKLSALEKKFAFTWKAIGGPALEREKHFHPDRKWRFDFAHVESKIAIEIEGGVFIGGRHTRGLGFIGDCEKGNEALLLGWRVFRLPEDLITIDTLRRIENLMLNSKI